jgi:hypothetical protein
VASGAWVSCGKPVGRRSGRNSARAGIGYSVFGFMVAGGRFCGDRLKAGYGAVSLARRCDLANIVGLLLVLASLTTVTAFLGFAAMGFGVSAGVPLAVTAAASLTDHPAASGVAILSFVALLGFLVGTAADRLRGGTWRHAPRACDVAAGRRAFAFPDTRPAAAAGHAKRHSGK